MNIRPPPEVAWIIEAAGEKAALDLVSAFGGSRVYFPRRPKPTSPVAQAVGLEAARSLGAAVGQEYRKIPLVRRWRALHLRAAGLGYAEIARTLVVDESAVAAWLKQARMTNQPAIPGLL